MGVESFFINAKLYNQSNMEQLKTCIKSLGLNTSPYIIKYDGIFPTKKISEYDFVINNIVLCSLLDSRDISLQACFSCYKKSIDLMSSVLIQFRDNNIVQFLYYGDSYHNIQNMDKNGIVELINRISNERFKYFQDNYTSKELEILPNEFYKYYRRHRNELKNNG